MHDHHNRRVRRTGSGSELSKGALTLARIRELTAEVVAARRVAGDEHLHLVDGLELFGPEDADGLYDGLHPDADGYRLIGERAYELLFGPVGAFARDPA